MRDETKQDFQPGSPDITLRAVDKLVQVAIARQQEEFASVILNHLRTPVIAGKRMLNLLMDNAFGPIPEPQREVLEMLLVNEQDLEQLMLTLVDIYRYKTKTKKLEMRSYNLNALISACTKALSVSVLKDDVALESSLTEEQLTAYCDQGEISKLLMQLLTSSLHSAKSLVQIAASKNAKFVHITIKHNGPPIDKENLEHIFNFFSQDQKSNNYSYGLSASLGLCKEIAQAHGGTISCKCDSNQGTEFEISLPIEP
jgi:signal transduction histidine kinase